MVSIGPYHKNNDQLRPTEKYKLLYLRRFLKRNDRLDMDSCMNELKKLEEEALNCYDDIEGLNIKSHEFCTMLLLDGCFVVEFIRERCEICPRGEDEIIKTNIGCIYNQILRDLMLLENQLPFFVLNKLHDMTKHDDELPLVISNIYFMQYIYFHVMGTLRKHQMMTQRDICSCQMQQSFLKLELDETKAFLRNLIAYEQQSSEVQPKYFSDFAIFMDHIIDSDKDVNLLRQKGIIKHWMGEDKDVSSLFNKIGTGVTTYSTFYYDNECLRASQHCEKGLNRMIANLMHNYFSSPWVGASTVAAIILLVLTTIQTILAITSASK
ncbi:putative UPF0481 protein At3g02645 [Solanum stenotomum]|uniref:putative UPF0481 protein At3g02645 n=1 Tax=Solanum stenotomum TaxID=172797 RepID=UPI0020D03EC4|nr:putative UPF0481 protein At3g02645 [Solanum stenotomum]